MLLQHSRRDARTDADGAAVLLPEQDRRRWYRGEIAEAVGILTQLLSAENTAAASDGSDARYRAYLLQSLIAAEHAVAPTPDDTDWARIAGWYLELETLTGSPVVRLNRAVAVAEGSGVGFGPAAALILLDGLAEALPGSRRLPAVRAELLLRSGDPTAAADQFDAAIARCHNEIEAAHLHRRRAQLD